MANTDAGQEMGSSINESVYLSDDGEGIKLGKLLGAIASALVFALSGAWILLFETLISIQVGLINGLGQWLSSLVKVTLGGSAALMVDGWRVAFVEAVQFGPLAPVLLAAEAVVVLTIIFALWERRPYA